MDLGADNTNCGKCASQCLSGEVCSSGRCQCLSGLTNCATACVELAGAANHVKSAHQLCDCNVSGCSGGDLCTYGAQYITQDWAAIVASYASNSKGYSACLGGRPIIFEMEPDWYQ
ncbi:MAG TPA: hypothetical protein VGI10_28870 [Polyangiaceae bacterium]